LAIGKTDRPDIKSTLESVVKLLVDLPDRVAVAYASSGNTLFCDILVDESDLGTTIGSRGKHAHALRTLFMAASAAQGTRIVISIDSRND
jgi:predicted RNA-binding protein YlqC (UPF0109 family)